MLLTFTLKS